MTPSIRRRWPWFLLVGSLALNMLAGGFIVAHAFRPPPPPPGGGGPQFALERFIDRAARDLPPEDTAILRAAFKEARPLFIRMDVSHEEFAPRLRTALMAEPFDPARVKALFESNHETDTKLRAELEARVVDTLARLSPEARLRLAEGRMPP